MFWFIYEFHNIFERFPGQNTDVSPYNIHIRFELYIFTATLFKINVRVFILFSPLRDMCIKMGFFLTKKINIWFETIMIISHLLWGFYSILSWFIFFCLSTIMHLIAFKNKSSNQTYKKSFFYKETILQWHFSKLNVKMKLRFNLISKIYLKSTVKLYNHIPCIEFD